MLSIRIKELIPEENVDDKKSLLPVFLEIWNTPENLKYLSSTMLPFEPELVETWLQNHKDQGGRYFCALDKNDEILGIMVIKVNPLDGFEIYGVGVLSEQKGNGIGRQLIEYAIDTAASLGFKDLHTLVFADNTAMLCLLLTLGFLPVTMEYHKRSDGADAVHLKKYLKIYN